MKFKRIDWVNHFIAFLSSLLGIFIAFQLNDWQEDHAQNKRVAIALDAIKGEVDNNRRIFSENNAALQSWFEYYDFVSSHTNKEHELIVSDHEYKKMKLKHPTRFTEKSFRKYNDTLNAYKVNIFIDVLPVSGIASDNWEAAKSSGILNHLDHTRTTLLSQIYEWTNKDLGGTDTELLRNQIQSQEQSDNLKLLLSDFKSILEVSKIKLSRIDSVYKKIEWSN